MKEYRLWRQKGTNCIFWKEVNDLFNLPEDVIFDKTNIINYLIRIV